MIREQVDHYFVSSTKEVGFLPAESMGELLWTEVRAGAAGLIGSLDGEEGGDHGLILDGWCWVVAVVISAMSCWSSGGSVKVWTPLEVAWVAFSIVTRRESLV